MNHQRESTRTESAVAARFADTTYKIIGAAMQVHNQLGPGLKELTYHDALSAALRDKGLAFEDEKAYEVGLGGERVGLLYVDHLVEDNIVVEEKALPHQLTNEDLAQVLTYLAVSGAPLGLLLSFGRRKLEYKRILPPKAFEDWRERAVRYAWRPASSADNPLIRSSSADDREGAV